MKRDSQPTKQPKHKPTLGGLTERAKLLPDLLGEVILEQEDEAIFAAVEALRQGFIEQRKQPDQGKLEQLLKLIDELDEVATERVIHAFSTFFHLANISEELEAHTQRHMLEENEQTWANSFEETFSQLQAQGASLQEVLTLLEKINYYPTFTAHPTEAKSPLVLEALQRIQQEYKLSSASASSTSERSQSRHRLKAMIQIFWKTDAVRAQKPTVFDEVDNAVYYFKQSIFAALPNIYRALESALKKVFSEARGQQLDIPKLVQFGTWVGGDRDGNPFVTAQITRKALWMQHIAILDEYIARVTHLANLLTHSAEQVTLSNELQQAIRSDRTVFEKFFNPSSVNEPYRQRLEFIALRLRRTKAHAQRQLEGKASERNALCYVNQQSLRRDLELIKHSLASHGEANLARGSLRDLIVLLDCFGFNLARMDIRQESTLHSQAIAEMARNAAEPTDYLAMSEPERQAWLTKQLLSPTKLNFDRSQITLQSAEVLDVFTLMRQMHKEISSKCFGSYIISMTHEASHLLEVAVLAKQADLIEDHAGRLRSHIHIAPLFETVKDLEHAEPTLEALFSNRSYRQLLEYNHNTQEVMLGYSDSCKDGGILASSWNLYKAQQHIVSITDRHALGCLMFHGRGGTIGRGGGPTHESILSQPRGSVRGQIKFTEQGEVLSFKYNFRETAEYELTVGLTGLIKASVHSELQKEPAEYTQMMERLVSVGEREFRDLTDDNLGTMRYFYETTPSQEIGLLNIGSRPSHRKKQDYSKSSIRAIGWVFGWSQSRQNIPGWYGLGCALKTAIDDGGLSTLQAMVADWRYFRNFISNSQMVVLKTDQTVAKHYSGLCSDAELGSQTYTRMSDEYIRAIKTIQQVTGETEMMADYPVIGQSIRWRNAYLDPLNYIQINLLKRLNNSPNRLESRWLKPTLSSINGIATGLRNTG